MISSKKNGSLTHLRYGHASRPCLLEVTCPACGGYAVAIKQSESQYPGIAVCDLSPSYYSNDWLVKCLRCPKRINGLSYEQLPVLFFSGGKLGVWAWNSEHAKCIIDYLSGVDTSNDPYAYFMAYVRGNWKKNREKVVLELKNMQNKKMQWTQKAGAIFSQF